MSKEAMKLALEALELAKRSHGMMLLSDPPQEAWKTYRVDDSLNRAITALREALAEQPAQQNIRNATLDEIATKIGVMPFGDTAASFAVWIREQKTKTCPPCHGECNQGRACPARGGHA